MSINSTVVRNEDGSWSFTWTAGTPPYAIWLEGRLIASEASEAHEFSEPGHDENPPDLEILDSGDDSENEVHPPYLVLQWRGLQAANAYIIEEFINAVWVVVGERQEDASGTYQWETPSKEDDSTALFRVTAIDLYGNGGSAISFTVEIARNPGFPAVVLDINSSGDVVVSAA